MTIFSKQHHEIIYESCTQKTIMTPNIDRYVKRGVRP